MQKWPFFNNKPKVQPEQQSAEKPKPEAPQQIAPAQQSKPNNVMPAAQQKPSPSQQGVSNTGTANTGTANAGMANTGKPNMAMPAAQQKPNQQGMSNAGTANMGTANAGMANTGMPNMTMPAAQQKPNQQGVANAGTANMGMANAGMANAGMPNMTMPASKEMPAQMTLPTVPAPKDNSKFMVSMNNKGHQKSNLAGQQMNNANMMGQQMNNANTMGQQLENSNVMAGHTGGKPEKGENLQDDADVQVTLSEALNLIKNAIEGETEDRMFYEYLINNAPSRKDKEIIKGIRDDEIKHAKLFRQLYYEHTGKIIGPDKNVSFDKPASYCDGLIKALMGEQNAVRKYRKILFAMKERSHINTLTEIITDEISHGSLYNLLIHNNDCKY